MTTAIERTPIEKDFASTCLVGVHESWKIHEQPTVIIHGRKRRPDFLIENDVVGYWIECDGKDFHDFAEDREKDWTGISFVKSKVTTGGGNDC